MRLKIASRASDLARIQAFQVARALKAVEPNLQIEYEFHSSLGDQNLDVPLASWGSKGVFTQDFFEDLKNNKFDMVVHSWKDLPTETRDGTAIMATLERADVRDVVLIPKTVWTDAREALPLLSSSPRRSYNLQNLHELLPRRVRVEFRNVRGNVPTRIEKMFTEQAGLILAKAALDRLLSAPEPEFHDMQTKLRERLGQCHFMVLPISLNPPAAAQGALAIEIREGRSDLRALVARINHEKTFAAVEEERKTLSSYGGGCHQKIGVAVLPKPFGEWQVLRGLTDGGEVLGRDHLQSNRPSLPKAASFENVFPMQAKQNSWFERERLPIHAIDATAVMVAKAEAWPADATFSGVIWTSGLTSWRKLARRGIWVNGCAEGLGDEDPRLNDICGPLKWIKLTHKNAPTPTPTLATYKLVPKSCESSPSLAGKTHFFWLSASSFERAFELYPRELENGHHGSGPGLTHQFLQAQRLRNPPKVFLGLDAFLNEVLPP